MRDAKGMREGESMRLVLLDFKRFDKERREIK